MYRMEILLILVLVGFSHGTSSLKPSNWNSSWVVGGTTVFPHYPYMVALRYKNSFMCGGTIIQDQYILTAAHCVHGRTPSAFTVLVGSKSRIITRYARIYGVESLVIHRSFNPSTYKNDIAIIKLNTPIAFSRSTRAVTLANQDEETAPGTSCHFMGWGITEVAATMSPYIYNMITLKVLSTLECLQSYMYVSNTYICADAGPGKGTSRGDAGGPLICNNKQVGVYSGGGKPGSGVSTPYASLFVNVAKFRNWIQEHTV